MILRSRCAVSLINIQSPQSIDKGPQTHIEFAVPHFNHWLFYTITQLIIIFIHHKPVDK